MVISKISSGLGNQLFQYAVGRHLSILNHSSLCFDLRYYRQQYSSDTPRSFKLHHFRIPYKVFDRYPHLVYLSKTTRLVANRTLTPFFKLVKEQYHHFDASVLDNKALFLYLNGFWQSECYFNQIQKVIREDLQFRANGADEKFTFYKREILSSENAVSIHIRRGDYVHHPEFSKTFGFLGLEYYQEAVSILESKLGVFRMFIFTDDALWVDENFRLRPEDLIIKNTGPDSDISDLHLMSLCKHNVVANSSFSWWGAWLNSHSQKVIIAPKKWYLDQPHWNTKDLVPRSWLKI